MLAVCRLGRVPLSAQRDRLVAIDAENGSCLTSLYRERVTHIELLCELRAAARDGHAVLGRQPNLAHTGNGQVLRTLDGYRARHAREEADDALPHALCRVEEAEVEPTDRVHHDEWIEELVGMRRAHEEARRALRRDLELVAHADFAEEYFDKCREY